MMRIVDLETGEELKDSEDFKENQNKAEGTFSVASINQDDSLALVPYARSESNVQQAQSESKKLSQPRQNTPSEASAVDVDKGKNININIAIIKPYAAEKDKEFNVDSNAKASLQNTTKSEPKPLPDLSSFRSLDLVNSSAVKKEKNSSVVKSVAKKKNLESTPKQINFLKTLWLGLKEQKIALLTILNIM